MTTLLLVVDHLAAEAPEDGVGPAVAVADGVAERHAHRMAVGVQLLGAFEDLLRVGREFLEARLVHPGLAVDHAGAGGAERQADPLAVAHAVFLRRVVPAAVFVAEIFGEVGQRHELVGILVRVVVPAEDDVRAGADIGGDRRLRPDVLPGFRVELHRHAGRLGERLGVGLPLVLVALHELRPAQHAELRALLRREVQLLASCAKAGTPSSRPAPAAPIASPPDVRRRSRLEIFMVLLPQVFLGSARHRVFGAPFKRPLRAIIACGSGACQAEGVRGPWASANRVCIVRASARSGRLAYPQLGASTSGSRLFLSIPAVGRLAH